MVFRPSFSFVTNLYPKLLPKCDAFVMIFTDFPLILRIQKKQKYRLYRERSIAMKQLLPVAAGVLLCLACTVVGFLFPQFSSLAYVTVSIACVTGLLCLFGILRHITRGGAV